MKVFEDECSEITDFSHFIKDPFNISKLTFKNLYEKEFSTEYLNILLNLYKYSKHNEKENLGWRVLDQLISNIIENNFFLCKKIG